MKQEWFGLKYIFPKNRFPRDFSSAYGISKDGQIKNVDTNNLVKVTKEGRTRKCKIVFEGRVFHINVDKALLQLGLIDKIEYKKIAKAKSDYKLSELFPFISDLSLEQRQEFADLLVDSFTKALLEVEHIKKRGDTNAEVLSIKG